MSSVVVLLLVLDVWLWFVYQLSSMSLSLSFLIGVLRTTSLNTLYYLLYRPAPLGLAEVASVRAWV